MSRPRKSTPFVALVAHVLVEEHDLHHRAAALPQCGILRGMEPIAQLSARGTVTLPAAIRRSLGLAEGDVLTVTVRDGRIVLTPAAVTPVELYSEERIAELTAGSNMTEAEMATARRRWRRPRPPG